MRKVIVNTFVSLDGIIEEPRWTALYWADDIAQFQYEGLFSSDALLLGRITYEGFAASWPDMSDEQGFADRMNNLPKYVASRTLSPGQMQWKAELLGDDVVKVVRELKKQPGDNILMYASPTFMHTLMEHNLIDEYRLLVYPVVLGEGQRLFSDRASTALKLTETRAFSTGVVLLRYEPAEKPE
ncbi:MAG: dihydrofolate reductase family protein [Chloroflexi bacterium]|nr:dihydrofolate reductase family protein [Chloroflexota bacterium]